MTATMITFRCPTCTATVRATKNSVVSHKCPKGKYPHSKKDDHGYQTVFVKAEAG